MNGRVMDNGRKRSGRFKKSEMKARTHSCSLLSGRRGAVQFVRKPQSTVMNLDSRLDW